MSKSPVIIFCFGGRRPNMELQLPFIQRILDEHPHVSYHLWNLAKDRSDYEWLRTVRGDRITVINDFHGPEPWRRFNDVYRCYADDRFSHCTFVKLDDDVVFIETDRFSQFVDSIHENPDSVMSAKVVNNGACTPLEPGLWNGFQQLSIPLLDVHLHGSYAQMSHFYFMRHWEEMVEQDFSLVPTEEWLSINLIGYTWRMGRKMAKLLDTDHPPYVAGREFLPLIPLGDEGMVNTLPRIITQGFLACHLYFGPQARDVSQSQIEDWQLRYRDIGQKYLAR